MEVIKKTTICIDMGASTTKYSCNKKRMLFPNDMVVNDEPSDVYKVGGKLRDNFEMVINRVSGEELPEDSPLLDLLGKYVSLGTYATKSTKECIRPSIDDKKCRQAVNYASVIGMVAFELAESNRDLSNVELFLAVPPIEIKQAREAFGALVGGYAVELIGGDEFPTRTIEFDITYIDCYEESVATCVSFFIEQSDVIQEDLLGQPVLVFDIGASTTDVAICRDMSYIDNTLRTIRCGGNMVRDEVSDAVYREHEVLLQGIDLERAIMTGKVFICGKPVSIVPLIDEAKKHCASRIMTDMQTYFRTVGIDKKTIAAVILSGGGSLRCGEDVLTRGKSDGEQRFEGKTIGYYISEQLGIDAYYYGDSARFANVEGLRALSMRHDRQVEEERNRKRQQSK